MKFKKKPKNLLKNQNKLKFLQIFKTKINHKLKKTSKNLKKTNKKSNNIFLKK